MSFLFLENEGIANRSARDEPSMFFQHVHSINLQYRLLAFVFFFVSQINDTN